jgi:hypothetical protein
LVVSKFCCCCFLFATIIQNDPNWLLRFWLVQTTSQFWKLHRAARVVRVVAMGDYTAANLLSSRFGTGCEVAKNRRKLCRLISLHWVYIYFVYICRQQTYVYIFILYIYIMYYVCISFISIYIYEWYTYIYIYIDIRYTRRALGS